MRLGWKHAWNYEDKVVGGKKAKAQAKPVAVPWLTSNGALLLKVSSIYISMPNT
jgi:hypothetical protein